MFVKKTIAKRHVYPGIQKHGEVLKMNNLKTGEK